jgi:hypothetical protein
MTGPAQVAAVAADNASSDKTRDGATPGTPAR